MFSTKSEQLTLAGAVMVAIGAFAPMVNIGGLGTVSYADANDPGAIIMVIAALAAAGLIAANKKALSPFATVAAWLVLLWPVIKNIGSGGSKDDGGMLGKVMDKVKDPLSDLAGRIFTNVFDFEWGGWLFILGLLLLTIGSVMVFKESRT